MNILLTCIFVHQVHAFGCPEEGTAAPGPGIKSGCDLSCGCWEVKPGPLEEQQILLTPEQSP